MIVKEIIFLSITTLILSLLWKWKRFLYLAYKIPKSQFDLSLKGMYEATMSDNRTIFRMVYDSFRDVNGLAKTWLGPVLFIIIGAPEDVKTVMNSKDCLDKPYFLRFLGLSKGTLFGEMEFWHKHRKILDPHFGQQKLKKFLNIFDEKSKVLIQIVSKMEGKGDFNIFYYMTALTLETVLNAMELDADIQNLESKQRDTTIEGLEIATRIITRRIFKFWLHPDFIYTRTNLFMEEMKALAHSAFSYADNVIKNIRKKVSDEEFYNEEQPSNFIRALINTKYSLTDSELNDEIKTLLIAAQDTTAISISAALLLLAMHKEKQDKVVNEIYEVIGSPGDNPITDIEQLNKLEYLEMVINETLRLMPVVPCVFRSTETEIKTHEGYIIPANANLIIPIFKIHRNKNFWGSDADDFKPERFEKENIKKVHPYAFIPFTKGPRMCLGWRYAILLIKIQLCNFLIRYEVDTSLKYNELEFELNITLNIYQGFKINIKNRKN